MVMGTRKKKHTRKTYSRSPRKDPHRRGMVALMLVALIVVCAAASAQVWTRLRSIDSGYKLSEVNAEHDRLQETNRQLRIELALLKNPARVKDFATRKLGMAPPKPHQVRRLVDRTRRTGSEDQRLAGARQAGARGERNGT